MAPSTVHAVLARNHMSRLAWMDRPTGRVIRRYEHQRPGDLVHVDVKKLGKVPPGGGWRAHGRQAVRGQRRQAKVGYCFVHSAVDDHSRLAYSEIHDDEQATTAVGFWRRARAFYAGHGIAVRAVLTRQRLLLPLPGLDQGARRRRRPSPAAPAPTGPRPTARSSASTERCWRNGPTSAPTPQRRHADVGSTAGSIRTTITAATPPSEGSHRLPVSTTSLGTTPRPPLTYEWCP